MRPKVDGCAGVRWFGRHSDHCRARTGVRGDLRLRLAARGAEPAAGRRCRDVTMTPRMTAVAACAGTLLGVCAWAAGAGSAANVAWAVTTLLLLVPLTWSVVRTLSRGDVGVDAIALLSMVGALAVGEYLAGAVIAVMLATGEALERYAQGRAAPRTDRAPRTGTAGRPAISRWPARHDPDRGRRSGDLLAIRPGEVVPVDGMVVGDPAVLDESALTGESRLVTREEGDQVSSGTVNAGSSVRSSCRRDGRRERLRRDRPARRGGTAQQGAVRPPRGSLRPHLRPVHAGHLRGGLAALRRPRSRAGRPGRGDPVPAPAGRADRDRRRDLPGGPPRRDRQGRRAARSAGAGSRSCSTRPGP